MKTAATCHSVMDLRELARRRLPDPVFQFLDGGSETEATMRRNTAAFEDCQLIPRCLVNVESVDTSTRVLGQRVTWPVICAPTGASRLFHAEGELAVARAAAKSGTLYALATGSTYSLEDVASVSQGPKMFLLYPYKDRSIMWQLMERSRRAGYTSLCLMVDVPAMGKRERDLNTGFHRWPRLSLTHVANILRHPSWVYGMARKGPIRLANFPEFPGKLGPVGAIDASITWKHIGEIIERWQGPFAIKGIMSATDAHRCVEIGANAIFVSNHGGRQLDGAAAPLDVLPEIVAAVGGRIEVILDGGIRRGVHVLKALALGATACSIGRPYLYGLAAGGEPGVARALELLRSELECAMKLTGRQNLAAIDASAVRTLHGQQLRPRALERVVAPEISEMPPRASSA